MKHKHDWMVFSTALKEGHILVMCECGDVGVVKDPTRDEWGDAFHAPSSPYPWNEPDRVEVLEGLTAVKDKDYEVWRLTRG